MKILTRDFNVKTGSEIVSYDLGMNGLGVMKKRGEISTNLCAVNQYVIEIVFSYERIHNTILASPHNNTIIKCILCVVRNVDHLYMT